jgi:hypothetical protein
MDNLFSLARLGPMREMVSYLDLGFGFPDLLLIGAMLSSFQLVSATTGAQVQFEELLVRATSPTKVFHHFRSDRRRSFLPTLAAWVEARTL